MMLDSEYEQTVTKKIVFMSYVFQDLQARPRSQCDIVDKQKLGSMQLKPCQTRQLPKLSTNFMVRERKKEKRK